MKIIMGSLFLSQVFLSDVELYYSTNIDHSKKLVVISDDEAHHIIKVMRHEVGAEIFVTDGCGIIYKCQIETLTKRTVVLKINDSLSYNNRLSNYTLCFPRLKISDRFEFALEKCVELGFTNFKIYRSEKSQAKGEKIDRWNRIAIAAMKQSLNAWLPQIEYYDKTDSIVKGNEVRLVLDQKAEAGLEEAIEGYGDKEVFLFLGPESGLTKRDIELIKPEREVKLVPNRLRAETAVVTTASIVASKIK